MISDRRLFLQTTACMLAANAARIAAAPPQAVDDASPVASVRNLGPQFLKNPVNVTGADGATSIPLPSGEALWLFGDTVEGPFQSIRKLDLTPLRSNTAAIVAKGGAAHGIEEFQFLTTPDGKRPRQVIPFADDEDPARHRVWPVHGACVRDQLYVFYHRISLLEGVDVFENFQLDGMGIARAKIGEWQFTRLKAPDGTHLFWKGDQPSYGVFVEPMKDYVYLWGSLMTGMFLTRVKPDDIEHLDSYEYLVSIPTAGEPDERGRWSMKYEPSAVLFDSVPNEMSAGYNAHLGKYLAIHALGREGSIVMRTAPQITGPWSAPSEVYRVKDLGKQDFVYAAKEHPEFARENGRRIYVTFVNSASYIPQLLEVTLR